MSRTNERFMLAVGAALMLGGCSDTGPVPPTEATVPDPQFSFTNAPSTPNVYRTAGGFVFGLPDVKSGLIAWVGYPTTPSDAIECGGTLDYDLTPIQSAGQLQAAFNTLALKRDMHIHVFDISAGPIDTCVETPIAAGTGNFTFTDNDAPVAGPGTDSFGARVEGTLILLSTGAKVRVTGETQVLIKPDGSFQFTSAHVSLRPVGGK